MADTICVIDCQELCDHRDRGRAIFFRAIVKKDLFRDEVKSTRTIRLADRVDVFAKRCAQTDRTVASIVCSPASGVKLGFRRVAPVCDGKRQRTDLVRLGVYDELGELNLRPPAGNKTPAPRDRSTSLFDLPPERNASSMRAVKSEAGQEIEPQSESRIHLVRDRRRDTGQLSISDNSSRAFCSFSPNGFARNSHRGLVLVISCSRSCRFARTRHFRTRFSGARVRIANEHRRRKFATLGAENPPCCKKSPQLRASGAVTPWFPAGLLVLRLGDTQQK